MSEPVSLISIHVNNAFIDGDQNDNVEIGSEVKQEVSNLESEGGALQDVNNTAVINETTSLGETVTTKQPHKKKQLSVSFPDSNALVIGYNDPPNPWANVPECTTSELLAEYRKGCDDNGIKPLPKVLQQLQLVDNNKERYEILSLKGEKLDCRHVESLEEIFRRVQFKTIDLEGSHLDEGSTVALFDMIEYYESAQKINISFNKHLGIRGWQACARLIKKTPSLAHMDARNCELNERVMPILGRSLRLGTFLKTLHLENSYLSGRSLMILVAALKMNETLQELFLADNKLMPSDAIQLCNLLKYNHTLQLLDIRNNHIQDTGVGHLSDGLFEQNLGSGLNTLVLWNNQITYQGMQPLTRALGSTESLETLNLGHNSLTNEGVHLLKEGLLKNKSLLRIGLQSTKITCEGAVALAEYIADSRKLLRLDLRENDIKTAGLMALSLSLKVSETVTKLDIDREMKKEAGVKDFADQQKRLQQTINEFLTRNREISLEKEREASAEKQAKLKNTEAAKPSEPSPATAQSAVDYFPTCRKIQRPQLLFTTSPQQSLESPGNAQDHTAYIPGQNEDDDPLLNLPPTAPDFLLSPQYCEMTTIKKLFSVTKAEAGQQSAAQPNPSNGFPIVLPPTELVSTFG